MSSPRVCGGQTRPGPQVLLTRQMKGGKNPILSLPFWPIFLRSNFWWDGGIPDSGALTVGSSTTRPDPDRENCTVSAPFLHRFNFWPGAVLSGRRRGHEPAPPSLHPGPPPHPPTHPPTHISITKNDTQPRTGPATDRFWFSVIELVAPHATFSQTKAAGEGHNLLLGRAGLFFARSNLSMNF